MTKEVNNNIETSTVIDWIAKVLIAFLLYMFFPLKESHETLRQEVAVELAQIKAMLNNTYTAEDYERGHEKNIAPINNSINTLSKEILELTQNDKDIIIAIVEIKEEIAVMKEKMKQ